MAVIILIFVLLRRSGKQTLMRPSTADMICSITITFTLDTVVAELVAGLSFLCMSQKQWLLVL